MKLFQKLLVAPATLGLFIPFSATANEVTISDFAPAEELAITNSRVDGLEARLNDFEAGSFSDTTTASFSADFAIGAVDGGSLTTDDTVMAGYAFKIGLSTSFTGDDSLNANLKAGNAGSAGISEFDLRGAGDELQLDDIWYTFNVGDKLTFLVGDSLPGSKLFNTACVYGGPSNTLDDCGNVNGAFDLKSGTTAAASYEIGNGFTAAVGYTGPGDTTAGLMTKQGADAYGLNLAYSSDSYGLSATYSMVEDGTAAQNDDTYTSLNAYWTPDGFPSISVGYEWGNDGSEPSTSDQLKSYFVGVQFDEVGPGKLGVAMGTKTPTVENSSELLMYEAFYSYPVNDSMTITPLVYIKEFPIGTNDETGLMVKSSFRF